MRLFIFSVSLLLAVLYGLAGFYFYEQETWAWNLSHVPLVSFPNLTHPEATLGLVRHAFDANDFSRESLPRLRQSLEQAPSFYQPSFFLAAYYANRLEDPKRARRAFEAALKRYPANGRVHLAYAQWLLAGGATLADGGLEPAPRELAERHLESALRLEPELTAAALNLMRQHRITRDTWARLTPHSLAARRELLSAFISEGYRTEARALLKDMAEDSSEPSFLEEAATRALEWKEPALALEVARRWQQQEELRGYTSPKPFLPGLFLAKSYLDLGEPTQAEEAFRSTLEKVEGSAGPSPSSALELQCAMGYEYFGRGRILTAQSLFAEAALLAPSYVPARLGLARTYVRTGQATSALEEYRRVLQVDPDNQDAKAEMERIALETLVERPR